MYSVTNYGRMIGDNTRTNAYQQAIQQLVNSDSVVVDLGAGLGILSFLACAAGARKVYAIEPDDVITVAQEIARQKVLQIVSCLFRSSRNWLSYRKRLM